MINNGDDYRRIDAIPTTTTGIDNGRRTTNTNHQPENLWDPAFLRTSTDMVVGQKPVPQTGWLLTIFFPYLLTNIMVITSHC